MFARFDENPAMTLQDIRKQNVTDGRTDAGRTHTRTDGQRENSIPTTNKVRRGYTNHKKVCGGINISFIRLSIWAFGTYLNAKADADTKGSAIAPFVLSQALYH